MSARASPRGIGDIAANRSVTADALVHTDTLLGAAPLIQRSTGGATLNLTLAPSSRASRYHQPPPQATDHIGCWTYPRLPSTSIARRFHPTSAVSAIRRGRSPRFTRVPAHARPAMPAPSTTTSNLCSEVMRIIYLT